MRPSERRCSTKKFEGGHHGPREKVTTAAPVASRHLGAAATYATLAGAQRLGPSQRAPWPHRECEAIGRRERRRATLCKSAGVRVGVRAAVGARSVGRSRSPYS